jgi:hypothetical protein
MQKLDPQRAAEDESLKEVAIALAAIDRLLADKDASQAPADPQVFCSYKRYRQLLILLFAVESVQV